MASNPNIINGLRPVNRRDGAVWRDSLNVYYVPAGNTNALYVGDPVLKVAASADTYGYNGVDLAVAGSTHLITGVVCGFLGTCKAGSPGFNFSNVGFWGLAGTPGPVYRPASTALDYYVLVNDDPEALWYVMSDNDYGGTPGTPVPVAAVGKNINLVAGTGSVLGDSGWYANSDSIATTAGYQCNILGIYTDPQFLIGNLNQRLIVRINQLTEVPGAAGI